MNRLLYLILVILALIIGAAMLIINNADSLVRRAIEVAGTNALGTEVKVNSVKLDLMAGTATLSGFSIANPEGFSRADMLRFDELNLAIDLPSLNTDVVRINSIRPMNPYVLYEMQGSRSNLDVVRERFASSPAPTPPASGSAQLVMAINEVVISGIQATLNSDLLPAPVNVSIGDVVIPPVQGTPEQLAQQIARPLLAQLGVRAATALATTLSNMSVDELRSEAEDAVQRAADQFRNRLTPPTGN
ncbi:MAG: hypothetical protein Q8S94_03470 [Pseudohongiella sp.]|nr:hypothetical protein [Pseudohongiella sp.]